MKLGAFSVSLAVKDLAVSRAFYEKLGFEQMGGQGPYAIMKNGETVIGLFEGMFEGNILTFNPGWDQSAQPTDPFTDVRQLRQALRDQGVEVPEAAPDEAASGPASFVITDPDGNTILIDQHR